MILEGLCTTINADGTLNVAPMGPVVDEELTRFLFRPFQSSMTFANLQRTGCGVFHVTDDVGMIALAAIGQLAELPETFGATAIDGQVIASACRWYEFEVESIDASEQRSEVTTVIKHVGRLRDYWGLNRARHAILEAAILATRLHLLDHKVVRQELDRLRVIVKKTANESDARVFEQVFEYCQYRFD